MILLYFIIVHSTITLEYLDDKGNVIKRNIAKHNSFILKSEIGTYKFSNQENGYKYDRCEYTCIDANAEGHLNVCNILDGYLHHNNIRYEIVGFNKKDKHHVNLKTHIDLKRAIKYHYNPERQLDYLKIGSLTTIRSVPIYKKRVLKIISIGVINDLDRYRALRKKTRQNTEEIIECANKILKNFNLDNFLIRLKLIDSINRHESKFFKGNQNLSVFEKIIKKDTNPLLSIIKKADIIILLTNDHNTKNEGMSFIKDFSPNKPTFIVANINFKDKCMYNAKVLIHEILHSLGLRHDTHEKGYIMSSKFINNKSGLYKISDSSKESLELYLSEMI